jgi:hypothetical protein
MRIVAFHDCLSGNGKGKPFSSLALSDRMNGKKGVEEMSRGSNYAGANSRLLTSYSEHQSTGRGSRREALLGLFVGFTILVFMLTACQLPAFSTDEMITVLPGQDLQTTIDEAPEGSTIILQAGESYKGALCIHKSITIRTDAPHEALGDIIEIALLDAACGFDTAIVVEAGTARIDGPIYVYEGVVDLIGLSIRAADSIGVTVNGGSLSMKRCLISYLFCPLISWGYWSRQTPMSRLTTPTLAAMGLMEYGFLEKQQSVERLSVRMGS